ncbi:MAG TPA: superoxide dismutase family protein [Candidatus Binatia bacterium]|nr:superoxide dismutase family protein [Candidatus Binatia bacterium]
MTRLGNASLVLALTAAASLALASGARIACAESKDAGNGGGQLMAVLHPVNQTTGEVDNSVDLGTARFKQGKDKVDVLIQVNGVPVAGSEPESSADGQGSYYPHGIHIHDGDACGSTKDKDDKMVPAGAAGPHFDPKKTGSHKGPEGEGHAGDLPNIRILQDGSGVLMTATKRLTLDQLKGRTVILHAHGDNYTDTPANGGSGGRIACGVIQAK